MVNVEKQRRRAELARQAKEENCIDQIDNRVGFLEEDRIPLLEERIENLEYRIKQLEEEEVRGAGFEPTDPFGKRS